ncbi:hypothetical protein [Dyella sp.]|jgi:hypothetical protein
MRSGVGKRIVDFLLALLVLFVMSGAGLLCVAGGLIWLGIYLFHHLH